MNISLPEPLKRHVERRVASGFYGTVSEFEREAIREKINRDDRRECAARLLEQQLLAGLDSGEPIDIDEDRFNRKPEELRAKHRERGSRS